MTQDAPLRAYERFCYGSGDFAFGLAWNMVGAFLLFFYTDVARLPAAAVGTLFLTARLFDAGVDLGVGVLVDRTRTRWGRTRPYFLFVGLPFCALLIATFWVPPLSQDGRLLYAFVTFNALGILYSLGSVPYSALLPMMTTARPERLKLSAARSIGTALSVIVATAATMPLVGLLGAGDQSRGFLLTAAIYAGASLVLIYALFLGTRERFHDDAPPRFDARSAIRDVLRNRAWIVTFLLAALNFVRFGAVLAVTPFFAIEVLRAPWAIALLMPAVSGTLLLGAFFAPPILRRTGMRRGWTGALVLAAILYLTLPLLEANTYAFVAVFVAASLALAVTMTAIFAMAAESVDHHERLFGSRSEGLLSSGVSLAVKLGMALGSAAIAFALAWAGYAPGQVTGPASAAIRWSYYGWPLLVFALQLLVVRWWPSEEPAT